MAKKPEPDPVRDMLRKVGFTDEQIYAMLGDLTPGQGRREGDRLYREYDAVVHFADARKAVMNYDLTDIDHRQPPNDRPDALAVCSSLGEVGIEVADVRPEMSEAEFEKLRDVGKDPLPADAAAALIRHRISVKDQKRQEPGWDRADNSILLLRTFQDIRKIRDHLKETNHAEFVPLNGFKEIWVQDAEYSFWKDGEFLGSAVVCIHPAHRWLARRILRLHRTVGLTNKDVYTPLEGPSKGAPLIAFTLGKPPRNE